VTGRAFRFFESASGGGDDGLSGAPAGLVVTATGAVSMIEGDAAIHQAIMMLLATTPGERLMRPDYGSQLRRLVFAPNDQTTAGLAIHYVRQAIERWEPRVEIVELDAVVDPVRPAQLTVVLRYRVRASLIVGSIEFLISLSPPSSDPVPGDAE
jgi:phage baseplate assembly protein W